MNAKGAQKGKHWCSLWSSTPWKSDGIEYKFENDRQHLQGWSTLVPLKAHFPEGCSSHVPEPQVVPPDSACSPALPSSLAGCPRWSPLLLFCGPRALLHSQPRISQLGHLLTIKPGIGLVKRREVIWYEQTDERGEPFEKNDLLQKAHLFIFKFLFYIGV